MVKFIVTYLDGAIAPLNIDQWSLTRGDHVVPTIAREQQEEGKLRPGVIISVRRLAG